jgi:anti-anti-sigma regulatory factor
LLRVGAERQGLRVTLSMTVSRHGDAEVQLDLRGPLVADPVAGTLQLLIVEVIVAVRPGTFLINLAGVTYLGMTGMQALLTGYITAIDYGTSYRVKRAHGQARRALDAAGILDMLADSDDIGALLLAVSALCPPTAPR